MKLKTTTKEACAMDTAGIISLESTQEQLLRGGFKTTDRYSTMLGLRLGGDKPGEAYDVLFSRDGFLGIGSFESTKEPLLPPKASMALLLGIFPTQ